MSSEYEYGEYYGEEEIEKEYKLFTLHPKGLNIDLESDDTLFAEKLFISGKWIFNKSVIDNLNYYLETYIPKYATAFLNQYSECDTGEMFFGIDDDGFIQGIPFKGELDYDFIKNKVESILNSDGIIANHDLSDYIDFELIKVNTDSFIFDNDRKDIIQLYQKEKENYYNRLNKYIKSKKEWLKKIKFYTTRLHLMMNRKKSRDDLIEFIKNIDNTQHKVIEILESDYVFEEIHGLDVAEFKLSKDNPWYWVCLWKDEMVNRMKKLRPVSPRIWSNKLLPINTITTIIDMIPIWLNKENINLYLIKFTFHKPNTALNISYKSGGEFISCYRSTIYSEPMCQPF